MRLIDADELKGRIQEWADRCNSSLIKSLCFIKAKDVVVNAPTVDAAPVVHGRWEYREDVLTMDGIKNFYQCSNCEKSVTEETFDDEWSMDFDRCPSCGARMDGGEGE